MITPIIFNPIENNPYFWWNGLEIPIQLKYLFEQMMRHEITIKELVDAVNKFNEDFEDMIKQEVVDTINAMYESGELRDIIAEIAEQYFARKPLDSQLDFRRIYRRYYNIGDNYRYQTIASRPCHVQSGTYITYNGIDYYVYNLVPNPVYKRGYSNSGLMVAVNVQTGAIEGQLYLPFQHFNSCDYNPHDQYLYVAGCLYYPFQDNPDLHPASSNLYRIHASELIDLDKGGLNRNVSDPLVLMTTPYYVTTNYELYQMKPDETHEGVEGFRGTSTNHVSYSNNLPANHIYVGTGNATVYEYDWVNRTIVREMTSESLEALVGRVQLDTNFTMQTGFIFENYLYILTHSPCMIMRCNLTTQKIEYTYQLPQILNNGYFCMGEPECLKIRDNGDMYMFSNLNNGQSEYQQFKTMQIFKTNIFANIGVLDIHDKKEVATIYVDRTRYMHNPRGTKDNPFNTIFEAVTWCNNNEVADAFNINMQSNSNYAIEVITPKKVKIRRADARELSEEGENYEKMSIGGLVCSGAGNCIISNLSVHMSYPDPASAGTSSYIRAWDSSLVCHNIYIAYANLGEGKNITTAIALYFSTGLLSGGGNFTVGNGHSSGGDGIEWTAGTFIYDENSSFNAHTFAKTTRGVFA